MNRVDSRTEIVHDDTYGIFVLVLNLHVYMRIALGP